MNEDEEVEENKDIQEEVTNVGIGLCMFDLGSFFRKQGDINE